MPKNDYTLHLKGYVGGDDFNADYVDFVLAQNEDKPVNVLIDSTGGSLATALSIAAAFRRHGSVSVHFVGLNASAATIASLGAKHISIDENAMYLVHKCSLTLFEWGQLNADDLREKAAEMDKNATDLDKFDANIAAMYSNKCRKDKQALLDLMKVGGWLSAKEALEWGFVDEVTALDEPAPVLPQSIAAAMLAEGMPLPSLKIADALQPGKNLLQKVIAAIAAMLGINSASDNNANSLNIIDKMNKYYKSICSLLAVDGIALENGRAAISDEQLAAIDEAISSRDLQIDELNKQVADLKAKLDEFSKQPAEQSTNVVDNGAANAALSPAEQFCESYNNALKLFKLVRP